MQTFSSDYTSRFYVGQKVFVQHAPRQGDNWELDWELAVVRAIGETFLDITFNARSFYRVYTNVRTEDEHAALSLAV